MTEQIDVDRAIVNLLAKYIELMDRKELGLPSYLRYRSQSIPALPIDNWHGIMKRRNKLAVISQLIVEENDVPGEFEIIDVVGDIRLLCTAKILICDIFLDRLPMPD